MNAKAAALLMVGLLGAPVVFHLTQPDWEILQQGNGYRFMFNRRTGEFFVPGKTGVHSPGEKLVPIASKKKSVEQQARKTFNKNETAAPDMPKPVPAGAPDWAGDLFQELDEQREHNFRVQAREQESRVRERKSKSLGDRLIDGLIVTSGETLLMCAVVSLIGFVWFYFKPAPTDSDD